MKKICLIFAFCFYLYNIQAQDNFTEEEITFKNGRNKFSGTLSIPKGGKKHPALILISSNEVTNRDAESYGFKTFQIISDFFANLGMVVLRYDHRGKGKTKGQSIQESTIEDVADDIVKAFKYLSHREEVDITKIGLLGHSNGGMIAPLVFQKEPRVAFMVLLASPAVSGGEVILAQTEAVLKNMGSNEKEIQKQLAHTRKIQEIIKTEGDWEVYEEERIQEIIETVEKLPADQKKYITDPKAYAVSIVQQSIVKTNWYQSFVKYDPRTSLENLTCPTLAVFGGLDLQVVASQNEPAFRKALQRSKNKDFTTKTFAKANHLFQKAETGSLSEYPTLDKEFMTGFLDYIAFWIQKRFPSGGNTDFVTGKASYYNDKYHGHKTASGEKYDKGKLTTAAHKEYAFGTMLEVTNISNGKKVVVKVNDRLSKKNKRILDLSKAAAHAIDMIDAGIANVKVKILKK